MEEGLFSRLQSYFSASYGGRFVESLIKECVEEQPRLSMPLFGVKATDLPSVEYRFKVGHRTRIADLAFLDSATLEPTCLIELKYDDQKNPANAKQVDDYLKFCALQGCRFMLLSQHHLPRELLEKLPDKKSRLLFSDIADRLKGNEDSVAGMLRRFFIDRGLVMHKFEKRDLANLKSFTFRLFMPWGGQGRTQNKDAMGGGAAESFGHLLKNMNIIAKEVATHESGRAPTIDFHVDPWVDSKRIQKGALESPGEESVSAAYAKAGGQLYVFGRIRLDDRSNHWLQVEYGLGLNVDRGDKALHFFSYAAVYSNELERVGIYAQRQARVIILSNKEHAIAALKERIETVIDRAINRGLSKFQIAKLNRFKRKLG